MYLAGRKTIHLFSDVDKMKRISCILAIVFLFSVSSQGCSNTDIVLEPFTYSENFETSELSAWASYPIWQDAAYDEKMRVNTVVPGDANISLEQMVIPYSNVDNYAGAQKKLDMYLVPGSTLSLRYYLKTQLPVEFFKVRLAAGPGGKVDYTVPGPPTNRWEWLTINYKDFIRENPRLGSNNIKVNALAVLAKFPDADPSMPIYLGLDDIVFNGARARHFQFSEPEMYKLSEWEPYIPHKHYHKNDIFTLSGRWTLDANRVSLEIAHFTDRSKTVFKRNLKKKHNTWSLRTLKLSFPEGLYLAKLTAYKGKRKLSGTYFTIYIAPDNVGGNHPRLWFDSKGEKRVKNRLAGKRFTDVKEHILAQAAKTRKDLPLKDVIFDMDQFPEEDWIPTLGGWFDRINSWRNGIYYNSLAYKFLDDEEAGIYAKDLFIKICKFPTWLHPWIRKRGRHIYYPIGELGMDLAIGYDLLYGLFNDNERAIIQKALLKQVIQGAHRGYVEDNLVTCNTSNWVAHIAGGSLMCLAVMYGDNHDFGYMEPYFTGIILKDYDLIQKAIDRDGAYGEGYSYYSFSMLAWSKSLPSLENVFKVDLSGKINGSYHEVIWAGVIKEKKFFYFGDSSGNVRPLTNWAWLLDKYRDPLLGWLYNHLKDGETFMDVLYETQDVPRHDPFDEKPVRFFRDIGTTVFKSGWDRDDFVFVMRTGPFINHQHLDQGSFWLQDLGSTFIEERHGSTPYKQKLYQSHYIQPIAHSTIIIDNNYQGQRMGDPLVFAEGFEDYAFLDHTLDGESAAFSSGNIGRLYWGKVKEMSRNVMYLKPRTVLMLDVIVPAERDVQAKLLYQTNYPKDINAGADISTINTNGNIMHILHISPDNIDVKAEDMPHFYYTLLNEKHLEKEGFLSVSARTAGNPLVMINILTTGTGKKRDMHVEKGDGFVAGNVNGIPYACSTRPGFIYDTGDFTTDALAVTWDGVRIFAAKCTSFESPGSFSLKTNKPITCEISGNQIHYYHTEEDEVVFIDNRGKKHTRALPAGEGNIKF